MTPQTLTAEQKHEQRLISQAIEACDRLHAAGWAGDIDVVHAVTAGMDREALRLVIAVFATTTKAPPDRRGFLNDRIKAIRSVEQRERRARPALIAQQQRQEANA